MKLFTVDSFSNEPFKGNPAGVCILEKPFDDESLYLKISNEINYAETAFTFPVKEGFQLRWFTPTTEVKLCGHATLAAAKILFEVLNYPKKIISFHTLSGELKVTQQDNWLVMDFPMEELHPVKNLSYALKQFLKTNPLTIFSNHEWRLVELNSEEEVKNFRPNFSELSNEKNIVIITSKSNQKEIDFVSRVFAPFYGIPEDPVTGSAHCYLGKYWGEKLNKTETTGLQVSPRSGIVKCEITSKNRILIKGQCVLMHQLLKKW